MNLRPYQTEAIESLSNDGDFLLALPMGAGKSLVAVKIAEDYNSVRVICPASLKINWQREFDKWGVDPPEIYSYSQDPAPADITIFDEAHYLKNPRSLRSKRLLKKTGKTLFLTGTPILNTIKDLWVYCHFIDPVNFDNIKDFDFFVKNPEYLLPHLERFMFYRKREDILSDLPDFERQIIALPGHQDLEYETIRAIEDSRLRPSLAQVRIETALSKLPDLKKMWTTSGEKVIIFAHHRKVLEELLKLPNSVGVTGWMSGEERQRSIDRFESDEAQFIIISIHAGGVGLNLTSAYLVDFVEIDWTPANNEQCECRAHRIGQKHKVLSRFLLTEGSVDWHIYQKTIGKEKEIKKIL